MTPDDLIRQNLRLECQINVEGLLVPFPGGDPAEVARFCVYRHEGGYTSYFRHDLSVSLRERLAALPPERTFTDYETIRRILAEDAPCERMWIGKMGRFVHAPAPEEFPDVEWQESCYVVQVAGQPVAWAWTVRGDPCASECAVETAESYRQRGYGRQVTAAWAHDVVSAGRVAFYSYALANTASVALARSVGVVDYAADVVYH